MDTPLLLPNIFVDLLIYCFIPSYWLTNYEGLLKKTWNPIGQKVRREDHRQTGTHRHWPKEVRKEWLEVGWNPTEHRVCPQGKLRPFLRPSYRTSSTELGNTDSCYKWFVVQSLSCVWLFENPRTTGCQASLSLTISWSLLKLIHWVDDGIQPFHPMSPLSPPALNLSQHQGLFQRVGSSCQVTRVLELQLQHQFFQWIFRVDFL